MAIAITSSLPGAGRVQVPSGGSGVIKGGGAGSTQTTGSSKGIGQGLGMLGAWLFKLSRDSKNKDILKAYGMASELVDNLSSANAEHLAGEVGKVGFADVEEAKEGKIFSTNIQGIEDVADIQSQGISPTEDEAFYEQKRRQRKLVDSGMSLADAINATTPRPDIQELPSDPIYRPDLPRGDLGTKVNRGLSLAKFLSLQGPQGNVPTNLPPNLPRGLDPTQAPAPLPGVDSREPEVGADLVQAGQRDLVESYFVEGGQFSLDSADIEAATAESMKEADEDDAFGHLEGDEEEKARDRFEKEARDFHRQYRGEQFNKYQDMGLIGDLGRRVEAPDGTYFPGDRKRTGDEEPVEEKDPGGVINGFLKLRKDRPPPNWEYRGDEPGAMFGEESLNNLQRLYSRVAHNFGDDQEALGSFIKTDVFKDMSTQAKLRDRDLVAAKVARLAAEGKTLNQVIKMGDGQGNAIWGLINKLDGGTIKAFTDSLEGRQPVKVPITVRKNINVDTQQTARNALTRNMGINAGKDLELHLKYTKLIKRYKPNYLTTLNRYRTKLARVFDGKFNLLGIDPDETFDSTEDERNFKAAVSFINEAKEIFIAHRIIATGGAFTEQEMEQLKTVYLDVDGQGPKAFFATITGKNQRLIESIDSHIAFFKKLTPGMTMADLLQSQKDYIKSEGRRVPEFNADLPIGKEAAKTNLDNYEIP